MCGVVVISAGDEAPPVMASSPALECQAPGRVFGLFSFILSSFVSSFLSSFLSLFLSLSFFLSFVFSSWSRHAPRLSPPINAFHSLLVSFLPPFPSPPPPASHRRPRVCRVARPRRGLGVFPSFFLFNFISISFVDSPSVPLVFEWHMYL